MLTRAHKLKKGDFPDVLRRGQSLFGKHFSIKILLKEGNNAQFAVTVSKKISSLASDRNRIKRRFFEIARKYHANIKRPVKVVIFPKQSALAEKISTLEREFSFLLRKAGVLD